jgi:hypothetical protein
MTVPHKVASIISKCWQFVRQVFSPSCASVVNLRIPVFKSKTISGYCPFKAAQLLATSGLVPISLFLSVILILWM